MVTTVLRFLFVDYFVGENLWKTIDIGFLQNPGLSFRGNTTRATWWHVPALLHSRYF